MKKLLSVLLLVLIFAGTSFAENHKVGILANINVTAEEFKNFVDQLYANHQVSFFSKEKKDFPTFVFYNSLSSMILGLNAGEVDEIMLPEVVSEYVMNTSDSKYEVACVIRTIPISFSFGFRASDDPELKNKFNDALMSMKADGTLAIIQSKYIYEPDENLEPVKFVKYDNVKEKIKVAITGDLPPIDFISASGEPSGFNTAILAEIGKRLKINIELVDIDAGARAASLASGRSDVVFWFQTYKGLELQPDVPEGITLSEPYYSWDEFLHLKLAGK